MTSEVICTLASCLAVWPIRITYWADDVISQRKRNLTVDNGKKRNTNQLEAKRTVIVLMLSRRDIIRIK